MLDELAVLESRGKEPYGNGIAMIAELIVGCNQLVFLKVLSVMQFDGVVWGCPALANLTLFI